MRRELSELARDFIRHNQSPDDISVKTPPPDIIPPDDYQNLWLAEVVKHANGKASSIQSAPQLNQHEPKISDEGLSHSNDKDIEELVKETLGDNPQEAKAKFYDALKNYPIEALFELPGKLSQDKEWIETLK